MQIPLSSITILPNRQRRKIDQGEIEGLAQSFKTLGQLQPIVLRKDNTLVCGEKRLRAAQLLSWPTISAVYFESLDPAAQELAELDENVRRSNLSWQETSAAYSKIHELLKAKNEKWTLEQTANYVGFDFAWLSRYITAHKMLVTHKDKVEHCTSLSQVLGVAERMRNRAVEKELAQAPVVQSVEQLFAEPTIPSAQTAPPPKEISAHERVIQADFHSWADGYSGEPFNFLHCDFPYGINHQKSEQGGAEDWGAYEDTPEIYWALCDSLKRNWAKLVAPSAHIMFWFSLNFYQRTIEFFESLGEDVRINPFPLVWAKSDCSGILPDPRRGPRRTYETAFIISRGDRYVVKSIANHYAAPTTKRVHISEKPQPVLRHFFKLFVDENSTVLDPTCGGGNALAVAEEMKAKSVFGLDLNEEYVSFARAALRRANTFGKLEDLGVDL